MPPSEKKSRTTLTLQEPSHSPSNSGPSTSRASIHAFNGAQRSSTVAIEPTRPLRTPDIPKAAGTSRAARESSQSSVQSCSSSIFSEQDSVTSAQTSSTSFKLQDTKGKGRALNPNSSTASTRKHTREKRESTKPVLPLVQAQIISSLHPMPSVEVPHALASTLHALLDADSLSRIEVYRRSPKTPSAKGVRITKLAYIRGGEIKQATALNT